MKPFVISRRIPRSSITTRSEGTLYQEGLAAFQAPYTVSASAERWDHSAPSRSAVPKQAKSEGP